MADIYGSIVDVATRPFKWLASIVQRMRKEHRAVTAREELFAIHGYTPANGHGDQLTFRAGEDFLLKCGKDQKWWLVKQISTGAKGYVPMSYVARKSEMKHMEWYDMRTTRDHAEHTLRREQFPPGAFIIRPNTERHFTEALSLSVKNKAGEEPECHHYVIERNNGYFSITGGRSFPSLTHLVQYYAGSRIAIKQPLTFSVKKRETIEVWLIRRADIEIDLENMLGKGHFGKVYKGRLRGDEVAIKTVNLTRMKKELFMKEAEIAKAFSHKNIVKTLGVCSEPPYIVTEFMPGGSLKSYLKSTHLTTDEYLSICQKIACAMAHLEEKGIVHRDLAARNILVGDTHSTIKLADFGLARDIQETEYYKTDNDMFPAKWTAPEAFVFDGRKGKSTTSSDVWSFAVVMWEVYSKGAEPYGEDISRNEIYLKLKVDNWRLLCPTGCAPEIYTKMMECWLLEPEARPTFAELHAFLLNPYGAPQAE